MEEIRLGTIGSGMIAHAILDNVEKTEGVTLKAVYSRREETGREMARRYGAENVYTDLDAFLADEQINCVYIASPNSLHYPQAKKALLADKHVILEKPFCPTVRQARELVELAKQRNLLLVDATPTAYLPNWEIARRELPKLGRLRMVMSNFSQYSNRYDKLLAGEVTNVFDRRFAGGCLMDINYYNIYMNVALFGKPREIHYYPNLHPNGIDTSGVAVLCYEDFVSQNAGTKDCWGVNFFQIEEEKGYLYLEAGNLVHSVRLVTGAGEETFNLQPDPDCWSYEVQKVTSLLLAEDYETVYGGLDVMLDVIDTVERGRKSAGIVFPWEEEQEE